MNGFNDTHCTVCHTHIGWFGEWSEQPPCPKCGHYDRAAIQEVELKINQAREEALRDLLEGGA